MKLFSFIAILFLAISTAVAQYSGQDCPSALGSRYRAGTEIPIRNYYCGSDDMGYRCSFYSGTARVNRSGINPVFLGACTTTFCNVSSHILYLGQPGYNPQPEDSCTAYTSAGEGTPLMDTTEGSCVSGSSHVMVDNLSLEEQIPVQGVPFYLNYSSSRYKLDVAISPREAGLGGWVPNIVHSYDTTRGVLFYGYGGQRFAPRQLILSNAGSFFVPDSSGDQILYFDGWGRHYKTVDALTGVNIYKFDYDQMTKKLTKITDRNGKETLFSYPTNQVMITSPRGEITTLNLNASGMLSSVVNRNSETYNLGYNTDQLLTSFQKPGGQTSTVTYDANRNVVRDTGAGGDYINFARDVGATLNNQYTTLTTARGIRTDYVTSATENQTDRTKIASFGEQIISHQVNGENYSTTSSVGSQYWTLNRYPDPRFQWASIYYDKNISYQVSASPISIQSVTSKSVDAYSDTNPLAFGTLTTSTVLQGDTNKTYTSVYTAATKTLTKTSPTGIANVVKFNSQGLMSEWKLGTLTPLTITYNAFGDIAKIDQGTSRSTQFTYDTYGNIATQVDVLGRTTSFSYDNSNRLYQYTLPNGAVGTFGYDANGNVTSVVPPGKPSHGFVYGLMELASSYLPPSVNAVALGQETYEYNLDKQLTKINKSTGSSITLTYHATTGLPTQIAAPSGNIDLVYYANSDLVRYRNQTSGLNLEYTYLGKILNSIKTTGALVNQVNYTFNTDASVASIQVVDSSNASSVAAYTYNNDGLISKAGSLNYTRNNFGAVGTVAKGQVVSTNTYNAYAETSSAVTKYQTNTLASFAYTRDKHSRITAVTEILKGIGGTNVTTAKSYVYNTAGRLSSATTAAVTTTYEYDNNGNRTKKITPTATTLGVYDEQDRLVQYGNLYYTYAKTGERTLKTEKVDSNPANNKVTQYFYDTYGFLTKVILPNATVVEYLLDGQKRKVGKKVNGTLVQGYIYQNQLQIAAVTNGTGVVTKRFVYGEKANIPDLLITGGIEYRIVSDQIGTPRVVVNLSTGAVDSKLNVDEFGNLVSFEGTERLPFRFAGGLWDEDTKLLQFGARTYDPTIGRWLSKDPIGFSGGDSNLYGYVKQNPISYIDPNGMCPTCIFGAAVGGVIGGIANGVAAYSSGASTAQIATSVLIGAGTGALAGGLAGATGFFGGVGLAGAGAALNNAGNQAYFNGSQNIDWKDVGISAILGAGLGGVAGGAFGSAGYALGLSAGAASGVASVAGAVSGSTANNGIPGNACPPKK